MQRITVDIGGTFTDVVGFDEESGALLLGKSSSTPQNLVDGIFFCSTMELCCGLRSILLPLRGYKESYQLQTQARERI